MKNQIENVNIILKESGFKCTIWKGSRIYINGLDKDIKAYFVFQYPLSDFDPENHLKDTKFCVFSDCNQPKKWLINRAKQVKHSLIWEFFKNGLFKEKPCEDWQEVIL